MTISIAARDPESSQYGVAVASAFPAVGAVCPWVSADGAVVTQSWDAGADYGESLHYLLGRGLSLPTAAEALVAGREGSVGLQLHGIDAGGNTYAHTGEKCVDHADHVTGEEYTVAGDLLASPDVIDAVAAAFERASGRFTDRLLTALEASESAGGDKRGDNLSAAVLVHGEPPKLYHNLRVDTPGQPITDLREAYEAALETERGMDDEEMQKFWGDEVPETIREYPIRY
ncbi:MULTISPECIES: DUF1028 domain-containing protein [Halolamina]|uniref:Uncharacterized conserved protein, Ntn-hydrolase superfamily n=1 Tax=Halolamina pelagica TaxID=699431 RepID=A0A1I5M3C4_9EURY|nr:MULTISPECIES: DUF1028 domain-containing protein [Halolamina]NHX35848.1 DUF1028 domain-containing protein [Halolamina sp. R1-12]SFP04104.1 Uncharacterized conserved protein, Ntn-hydrolase superfamily [Halolamina pelagica]